MGGWATYIIRVWNPNAQTTPFMDLVVGHKIGPIGFSFVVLFFKFVRFDAYMCK